ncbi:MAG TPA: hypothetical protein VJ689_03945, partial [Gaiellaceae bacterium]|nr:hypothetical protein [Gaiellaceae bacterium]
MTDDAARRDDPAPNDDTQTVAFSPTPERRPEWARSAWLEPAEPVSASGVSSGGVTTTAPTPSTAPSLGVPDGAIATSTFGSGATSGGGDRSLGLGMGQVAMTAILSAVLASGGTVFLLQGGARSGGA